MHPFKRKNCIFGTEVDSHLVTDILSFLSACWILRTFFYSLLYGTSTESKSNSMGEISADVGGCYIPFEDETYYFLTKEKVVRNLVYKNWFLFLLKNFVPWATQWLQTASWLCVNLWITLLICDSRNLLVGQIRANFDGLLTVSALITEHVGITKLAKFSTLLCPVIAQMFAISSR